jgi:predicted ATPase
LDIGEGCSRGPRPALKLAAACDKLQRHQQILVMDHFVVISGCSSGGKSTLLAELSQRGHAVVAEPGRRIVQEELQCGGPALPWVDAAAFARRAIEMAIADRERARSLSGWVFLIEV